MTTNIRRQLTLFVEQRDADTIEKIRERFNPRQFELIKSHVTLCREDEIENLEQVIANLHLLTRGGITIEFGQVARFEGGRGVLLPAKTDNIKFHELRKQILTGINDTPRKHEPHITLMHPRNSTCTYSIFAQIEKMSLPEKLNFKKISLIAQQDGGRWHVLREFEI